MAVEGIENKDTVGLSSARILLLSWDSETCKSKVQVDGRPAADEILDFSGHPSESIRLISEAIRLSGLPLYIYGHQLRKWGDSWTCKYFIIHPDFLIDVTAITSCFGTGKSNVLTHLTRQFLYRPPSLPILIGTTVNEFFDELIINPSVSLEAVKPSMFKKNGLAFSLLSDEELGVFFQTLEYQFANLQRLVGSRFEGKIASLADCILEPSFYSAAFGIQGRLDVYYSLEPDAEALDAVAQKKDLVIELKSGKPYRSNSFGINLDHQVQTMLYEMMIDSVFEGKRLHEAMILYASDPRRPLRESPPAPDLQQEIIRARNAIVLIHLFLAFPDSEREYLLDRIKLENFKEAGSFARIDATRWLGIYQNLSEFEKGYFREYTQFVAREQWNSRLGKSSQQGVTGLASLWTMEKWEKEQNYAIISDLTLDSMEVLGDDYPLLRLSGPAQREPLHNFRIGDTLVLYRSIDKKPDVLHQQVFKCTMIAMHQNSYTVRLRTKQFPAYLIAENTGWNLEHDILDRSFKHQYENLFLFAQAASELRSYYLGLTAPKVSDSFGASGNAEDPASMKGVVERAIACYPYHLIWGPPGSGKTSLVIKNLVEDLVAKKKQHILLLAYTNRAVDEICESVASLGPAWKSAIVRIGSRYSVDPKFSDNLLDEQIAQHNTRKRLKDFLAKSQIICGTIASLQGKKEIFYIKNFDTIIVDEASQILEPNLIGLLVQAKRSILIGDHMQLPAVCTQSDEEAAIRCEALRRAGLSQKNQSLFERLIMQCKANGWDHAYTMLKFQGRMHRDIMQLPAKYFYNGRLDILSRDNLHQTRPYHEAFPGMPSKFDFLLRSRTLYVDVKTETTNNEKVNLQEAIVVAKILAAYVALYKAINKPWKEDTLGIISPYRAQIACIKQCIIEEKLESLPITVDTVERYQGGARDIILVSMVIRHADQVAQISSLNQDGLDRKLNVALTRAREQVIIVANKTALAEANALYEKLYASYQELTLENLN